MLQCVDKGWDTKEEEGMICKIQHSSVSCKYIIPSQNFILTFYYKRLHNLHDRLIPLEQGIENKEEDQIIDIEITHENNVILIMSMRESCSLNQVQGDLQHEAVDQRGGS